MAYTIGLVPFVLIRSVVAPFLARGDTFTPMKAALIGTAVNIVFKIALMGPLAQVGLALATAIGAWINFILVLFWAARAGYVGADRELRYVACPHGCMPVPSWRWCFSWRRRGSRRWPQHCRGSATRRSC